MKRLLSLLLSALAVMTIQAQETSTPETTTQETITTETTVTETSTKGHFFIGGTGSIGYTSYFEFALEPVIGYEIRDWFAIGTGIGMAVAANSRASVVTGIVEPFARFTLWHNNLVYIDLKATGAVGFTKYLTMAQIGIRPGIRFRVTEHCDIAADLGLFGAAYTNDGWYPALGVSATSVGLWAVYRF